LIIPYSQRQVSRGLWGVLIKLWVICSTRNTPASQVFPQSLQTHNKHTPQKRLWECAWSHGRGVEKPKCKCWCRYLRLSNMRI